jgi:hypothetical protein
MPIRTCWELGQRWYAGCMACDWQRPNAKQTRALVNDLGLTGNFRAICRLPGGLVF